MGQESRKKLNVQTCRQDSFKKNQILAKINNIRKEGGIVRYSLAGLTVKLIVGFKHPI